MCKSVYLAALLFVSLAVAQSGPVSPFKATSIGNTGLTGMTVMIPAPSQSFYIAGNHTTFNWLRPGGIGPDLREGSGYVARVSATGNTVFWAMPLNLRVRDLQADSDGNLWAAGFGFRTRGNDPITSCSTENDLGDKVASIGLAKLTPDGQRLLKFVCVGSDFSVNYSGPFNDPTARVQIDKSGAIYLSGSANSYSGFTPTAGALGLPPLDARQMPSPYAIKLTKDAASIEYATWLPVSRVETTLLSSGGNLVVAGSVSESVQLPATNGAAQESPVGVLLSTSDGGQTWRNAGHGLPAGYQQVIVASANPSSLLANGNGWLAISRNGGIDWTQIPAPAGKTYGNLEFHLALSDTGDTVYMLEQPLLSTVIWRYQHGQWNSVTAAPANLLPWSGGALLARAGATLYFFYDNAFVSTDAGATWQRVPSPDGSTYSTLHVSPADPRQLLRIGTKDGKPVLYRSSNFGQSWTATPMPVLVEPQLHPNNPSAIFLPAQTSTPAYRSLDSGQTWQALNDVPCQLRAFSPKSADYFYCDNTLSYWQGYSELNIATHELHPLRPLFGTSTLSVVNGGSASQFYMTRWARLDGFVCEINAKATAFNFCTYIGGYGDDVVTRIVPARSGGYWLAGTTTSRDFPVTPGALQSSIKFWGEGQPTSSNDHLTESTDMFLARLTADGRKLAPVTYFGGSLDESPLALVEDAQGELTVIGVTYSWDFPAAGAGLPFPDPNRPPYMHPSNPRAGFVLRTDASLSKADLATSLGLGLLVAGTILPDGLIGAGGEERNIDAAFLREPFSAGSYLVSPVAMLDLAGTVPSYVTSVVEPLEGFPLALTPGGPARIRGVGLAPAAVAAGGDPYPTDLGVQITIDGDSVPLIQVAPEQIDFWMPWTISPGSHVLRVSGTGISTPDTPVWVYPSFPLIVRDLSSLYAAAFNEDGSRNSSDNPALAGTVLQVLFTGAGALNSPPAAGVKAGSESASMLPVKAQIGPYAAEVIYAGVAPGYVGMSLARIRIPADIPASEYSLWLTMSDYQSKRALINVGGAQ